MNNLPKVVIQLRHDRDPNPWYVHCIAHCSPMPQPRVCLSAICEAAAAVSTSVVDEAVSSKSEAARERLRSSSSVASVHSDELGRRRPHYSTLRNGGQLIFFTAVTWPVALTTVQHHGADCDVMKSVSK